MASPRLTCWSCRGYPIAPEPFKCVWGKYAMFPHGGERCNAFEREPGTDETVAVESGAIDNAPTEATAKAAHDAG